MNSGKNVKIFVNIKEMAYSLLPFRGEMRCFHFCCIYKKKKLISMAFNKKQSHPKNLEYNYLPNAGICAEMRACLRAGREDYSGYSIYVLRIDRNDKVNLSYPCKGCQNLIKSLHFKEVYATNNEGFFEKIAY